MYVCMICMYDLYDVYMCICIHMTLTDDMLSPLTHVHSLHTYMHKQKRTSIHKGLTNSYFSLGSCFMRSCFLMSSRRRKLEWYCLEFCTYVYMYIIFSSFIYLYCVCVCRYVSIMCICRFIRSLHVSMHIIKLYVDTYS